MSEWIEVKIDGIKADSPNALATGPFGSAISSKFFTDKGIPVIRGGNLSADISNRLSDTGFVFISTSKAEEFKRSEVRQGDLVFTCWGTINQVGLIDGKGSYPVYIISNKQMKLTPHPKKADSFFLYYFFSSPQMQEQILSSNIGSSVPGFNLGQLKTIKLSLPPLPEQKVIASVLSSLDDKIDLLHRQNKTLEAMSETLFRQWFVEPIIQAERDGGKAEGYQNGKFDIWIETTIGGEWGKENPTGGFVVPVYCIRGTDIADLNTGIPEKTPVRYVKKKKFDNIEPHEGDIIIEISGGTENQSTGRTTYINSNIKSLFQLPLVFSNFCRLLKIKKEEYSFFVYSYLQYLYKHDEFFNLENGSSGIKNLDYKALLFELDYPMPQESMVLEFDKEVKDYFKKINKNKSQIHTLEKLRDTLLPKLMSGEVRVSI